MFRAGGGGKEAGGGERGGDSTGRVCNQRGGCWGLYTPIPTAVRADQILPVDRCDLRNSSCHEKPAEPSAVTSDPAEAQT